MVPPNCLPFAAPFPVRTEGPKAKEPVMVTASRSARSSSRLVLPLLLLAAGCQTVEPVNVTPSFTTSPQLVVLAPSQIAVLPVEDGSPGEAASRHVAFLRQEVMRQLPDRLYTPLAAPAVDAALRGNAEAAATRASGTSILEPVYMQKIAGQCGEEALFVLRVDQWDESNLLTSRRIVFQFQAALVASGGQQLWYGTLKGEVKAGGAGAAPRDRDYMARSCGELAIRELLLRLPSRQP